MRINENKFRNYICNILISIMLISLCVFSSIKSTVSANSTATLKPFYNGNTESNNVSIMVNVYMGTEYVEQILDIVKNRNVEITLFVGGIWASKNIDTLKKISESNNEIGNHGYFHKDHKNISYEHNLKEIDLCHKIVETNTNYSMTLFAPPSGSFNKTTLLVAEKLGYKTIMWTKDTIDWRDQDEQVFYERATKNARGGDFILMHPTKCTASMLDEVISFYLNKGYNLTTVSKNIAF